MSYPANLKLSYIWYNLPSQNSGTIQRISALSLINSCVIPYHVFINICMISYHVLCKICYLNSQHNVNVPHNNHACYQKSLADKNIKHVHIIHIILCCSWVLYLPDLQASHIFITGLSSILISFSIDSHAKKWSRTCFWLSKLASFLVQTKSCST